MTPSWLCPPWSRDHATTGELGRRAEDAAERYLVRRGLRPIVRNFRTRFGEIDLVMSDGDELVFVEVRLRSRSDFGDGAATVDARKQRRLARAAAIYLAKSRDNDALCRFDVVSIARTQYRVRFEWIRNAFSP